MNKQLTIIIPSYNDAKGVDVTLSRLLQRERAATWCIIVVDDCSDDNTAEVLARYGDRIKVLRNEQNCGYGASIKRGISAADTEWVATMDADGQHRVEDLERMESLLDEHADALIGSRTTDSHGPLLRRPGKWVLKHAANILVGSRIPDINCGLRIFRRKIILCLLSITSDRFSFSTSSLIALLQLGCRVRFVPVTIDARMGKSTVRQLRDGFYTLMLMLRLIFLFQPLRVLFPIGLGMLVFASGVLFVHLFISKMTTPTILCWVTGLLIFLFSLLADQVSGIRKDALLREIQDVQRTTTGRKRV